MTSASALTRYQVAEARSPVQDQPPKKENLSKKAGVLAVSRIITAAAQMASIMLLTRLLTKENFGTLSFLLLAYSTVITLGQLGLPDSIFYFFERVEKDARKSLALGTGRALFVIGLGGSLVLVALNFLAPAWGFQVDGLFFPLVLLILVELPTTPLPNILIAIDRTKSAAWFNIVVGLLQFTAMVVPAALGLPISAIITALVIYGFARLSLSYLLFFRNFRGQVTPAPTGMIREQFRYSLPLAVSQILWVFNRQIDKYIVAAFLPVAVYAEYVVGAWEIPFIPAIVYSVSAVMMPRLVSYYAEGQRDELLSLWNRSIRKLSVVILPLVVFFFVFAEQFISVFFTAEYVDAALPFRIYTLIILHRVAAYTGVLKAIGETRVITVSALVLVITNVILSVPLVMWLGMAGPPLATLVANIVAWVYVLHRIRTALGVSLSDIFPFAFYLRALAASAGTGVALTLAMSRVGLPAPVELVVAAALFFVTYIGLARLTGVVSGVQIRSLAASVFGRSSGAKL